MDTEQTPKAPRKKGLTVQAKEAKANPEPEPKPKRKKVTKRKRPKKAAPKKTAAKKAAPKKAPTKKRARKATKRKSAAQAQRATPSKESSAHRNWNWDFGNEDVIASFAKNLNEAIEAAGISQRQLAAEINYSRIAISNMTRGLNGATLPTLLRICAVLKVTPNDLLRKRG